MLKFYKVTIHRIQLLEKTKEVVYNEHSFIVATNGSKRFLRWYGFDDFKSSTASNIQYTSFEEVGLPDRGTEVRCHMFTDEELTELRSRENRIYSGIRRTNHE